MRPNRFALLLAFAAATASAQNTTAPATAPPPAKVEAPPPSTAPTTTPAATPVPVETEPAENVVVVREAAPPPPAPVTIDPDAAYPNGFADPADPFGNDMSLARQEQGGFNWGLLGLLGLLGLIPLFRGAGRTTRTVYVDRDDPRRILREEEKEG
jgi:hypothetical protein